MQKLVKAARTSADWYEKFPEHMQLGLMDFAYCYITRSGRIDDQAARDVAGLHGALRGIKAARGQPMTREIADQVPSDSPGAREIGFAIPQTYNASRILFDNLAKGRGDHPALIGPLGTRSYAELCAEACRWATVLCRSDCNAATAS